MENNNTFIDASLNIILECERTLEKITSSCCMPIRSKKMQDTFKSLDKISNQLQTKNKESYKDCIIDIEQCGGQLGKLFVSCCTEKREPLYQKLFKDLNKIHTNVHKAMGTAH